ncbi:hypothetical protein ST201phi2-1p407 [Pseudomonas phage 201phi2-1]|uniref:Uncharacterized protein n=1 Tax=Pseudomonas phage 201phi2-1 TaxID=198110 RepID=B3FJR6_BP201|nr:hypothetical protein ST201phi2-1p407 [Pseudomonas phage 201phi2-1]ABY63231.1 hypothetical protein 201phi2-1p407 [Pseudomonas phage 201phi2-1]
MDFWSGLFIAFSGGACVYASLGLMLIYRYWFESGANRGEIACTLRGVGLTLMVGILVPAILLTLHLTEVITMWRVGYEILRVQ